MAKILLVEDDNNLREIYEARLQAEGYTIVSAQDGEEALVVAKTEKPDLVISDVMMPRVSGFEMLDILRNTVGLKDVKVIMLTALGQAEDKTRADSLGADRYLVKSQVTLEDIVKAAQELLGTDQGPSAPQASAAAAEQAATMAPPAPVNPPTSAPVAPTAAATTPIITPTPVVVPPSAPLAAVPEPVATMPAPAPSQPVPTPLSAPSSPQPITAEPPQAAPQQPAAAVTPAAAPAMPAAPPSPPAPTQPQAQSVQDEEATIKSQIESFVNQNNQTAPAPTTGMPKQAMADAIQDLVSTAPQPQQPAVPVTPAPQPQVPTPTPLAPSPTLEVPTPGQTNDDSVSIAHKKVIKPISEPAPAAPGLNELLAKEGFDSLDEEPHPTAPAHPSPSGYVSPAHPPGHVISPNSGSQNGVDPNSIAL